MSYQRRMTRPDANQTDIVETLRKAGNYVWIIGQPVDLLIYTPSMRRWTAMEVKRSHRKRSDQRVQEAIVEMLHIPRVTTPEEALRSLGQTI